MEMTAHTANNAVTRTVNKFAATETIMKWKLTKSLTTSIATCFHKAISVTFKTQLISCARARLRMSQMILLVRM